MRRVWLLLLLSFCMLPVLAQDRAHTLKVYNWADYLDMDLIGEFESWYKEQTGEEVHIIYETFDINENMLTEIEVGHEDYDVVCPSEYIIERMLKRNLLQKIHTDFGKTPNWLDNVSQFAEGKFQQMAATPDQRVKDYSVGYMWGTTGILYNAKFVSPDEVTSWAALHNPKFQQKLYMKDAFRDIFSALICYARYDDILAGKVTRDELIRDLSDENISAVEQVLRKAKNQIAGWETDFGKERMTQEKAWVNVTWSGDAQWAIDEATEVGVDLRYTVPKEGSNCWFDGWVIPVYAKNVKAASYWIDFMCKSENAVRNMDATGYVSVIGTPEVEEAMEDSDSYPEAINATYFFGPEATALHLNPNMYPDISVINRCALMHDTADRNEAMLEMWSRVKGNNLDWKMLTFILIVLALLAGGILYRKAKIYRRRQLRRQRYAQLKNTNL